MAETITPPASLKEFRERLDTALLLHGSTAEQAFIREGLTPEMAHEAVLLISRGLHSLGDESAAETVQMALLVYERCARYAELIGIACGKKGMREGAVIADQIAQDLRKMAREEETEMRELMDGGAE